MAAGDDIEARAEELSEKIANHGEGWEGLAYTETTLTKVIEDAMRLHWALSCTGDWISVCKPDKPCARCVALDGHDALMKELEEG